MITKINVEMSIHLYVALEQFRSNKVILISFIASPPRLAFEAAAKAAEAISILIK